MKRFGPGGGRERREGNRDGHMEVGPVTSVFSSRRLL